ncbi:hypothetical protein TRVL_00383 [Trypanosoma vivax]|nr:hypothetical protein TRVL_00383 [Trypanosoma vivax]
MSSDDIDAFRAELLRQKIIFEGELRRQREHFESRLSRVLQELADREADCRNLQAVVTILGKKVDALSTKTATAAAAAQRRSPSHRSPSVSTGSEPRRGALSVRNTPPLRVPSPSARRPSSVRLNMHTHVSQQGVSTSSGYAPSTGSAGSRHTSPMHQSLSASFNGQRPKIRRDSCGDNRLSNSLLASATRTNKSRFTDDW